MPAEPQRAGSAVGLARLGGRTVAYVADEDDGTLHTVDLESRTELATTRLGGAPSQILVARDGRVFVALRDKGAVEVLEPAADAGAPLERRCLVDTPAEPVALAVTPDDATLLVSSGWGAALSGYETAGLARAFRVALPREPRAVVVSDDGHKAFVAHIVGSRMSVVDLDRPEHAVHRVDLTGSESESFSRGLMSDDSPERRACQGFALAKSVAPEGRILAPQVLVDPGRADERSAGYGSGGSLPPEVADVAVVDDATEHALPASITATQDLRALAGGRKATTDCLLPRAAAVDPVTGELLVACLGIDALVAYDAASADPRSAETRRWAVASGPSAVAVDAAGRRAVVWSQFDRILNVVPLGAADKGKDPPMLRLSLSRRAHELDAADTALGRKLFHMTGDPRISGDGRACASCHPDGRDDALTWATPDGPRQTPMLAGRLAKTGPYGWNGTSATVDEHLNHTFERLGGKGLTGSDREALVAFLDVMAPPPQTVREGDPQVARGSEVFHSAEAGCASCHVSEDHFTDHRKHEVGSAAAVDGAATFDTPSLRFVGGTAPYFHDGRYPTLHALLVGSDGKMGHTKQLSRPDLDALEAYLRSL
jgi:DNA-binding beta-propeller fold protein YncE